MEIKWRVPVLTLFAQCCTTFKLPLSPSPSSTPLRDAERNEEQGVPFPAQLQARPAGWVAVPNLDCGLLICGFPKLVRNWSGLLRFYFLFRSNWLCAAVCTCVVSRVCSCSLNSC
ncbi:hypothetical protein MRB53_017300 [Persea americana]|uniref:Uncharacterized protein n=1 Tax=Persea americana TaxID=3435 RepID=A0ACC2M4N7_PERAE|nr:hypothetical protein MRB53_017300 [Persea americana]